MANLYSGGRVTASPTPIVSEALARRVFTMPFKKGTPFDIKWAGAITAPTW